MSKNAAIEIILRVRPNKNPYEGFKLDGDKAEFFMPKDQSQGYINNQKQKRVFDFNQIFDMDARQQKIFDKMTKDVVDSALDGFNGTIFAYGQTGSGKTFTMTGGTESYDDRGIIPRTLSYIFNQKQQRNEDIKVFLSYMQIYNGTGYDLFDENNDADNVKRKLSDLKKVIPRQGPNGQLKLVNLDPHIVTNEEDALNLLFIGDTNRVVCKTPKNDESTRSHSIFMIHLETMSPGSNIKKVSTINLVDLSGSERIKETGVEGDLQKQAISINLGLHTLERVIVELNKKARGQNVHIPYRQSLMTTVLRDSIGGNSKTKMIATMSAKAEDIPQSISTCKFAQRVALIKNQLQRNEEVDPGIIISRLKKQNAQLKAELALLKGQDAKEELDKYQIQDCHKAVDDFIDTDDPTAALIFSDRLKINECFYYLKNMMKKGGQKFQKPQKIQNNSGNFVKEEVKNHSSVVDENRYADQIKKYKLLIQQRDNEIALLLSLINKKKNQSKQVSIPVYRNGEDEKLLQSVVKDKPMEFKNSYEKGEEILPNMNQISSIQEKSTKSRINNSRVPEKEDVQRMLSRPLNLSSEEMMDHAMAFDQFRRAYRKYEAMESNKATLSKKMALGKELGREVNEVREKVNRLKVKLQQLKRQNAVNSIVDGIEKESAQEVQIKEEMGRLKEVYRTNFDKLKSLKLEIENINVLQKKNVEQLQKDFLKYIKFKQQERENTVNTVDSSLLASNIKDQEVQKHLQSFLKARDQIRKK